MLEANLVIFLLRPYHTDASKRLIKALKLYFLDTNLACFTSVEITRSATADQSSGDAFSAFDRMGLPRAAGAVLSLAPEDVSIDDLTSALPFGAL